MVERCLREWSLLLCFVKKMECKLNRLCPCCVPQSLKIIYVAGTENCLLFCAFGFINYRLPHSSLVWCRFPPDFF